ncbi:GPR1/FUN34/yaaH family protein [Alteracholeplasma palmae J233]|uniref:GPR1/FUN34/yaaH family protein n=1 Tax=Alteracholeplasma palmae (strain ATCC 49389 / J233) TaxID=1318466 RepID=U4KQJ3_ALTPJ|nr:GPR1/FUN34/YaaH family transporter [Alteracholeplasma palmae]CCV64680.1 GPR1/FUN34/yaaH family protein [Alteracholeplasma palmae J233]
MSTTQKVSNPAPLGLMGFGMTTVLLNLHNSGIMQLSMVIVAMGITLGGLAQIIAGIMEFKEKNTFGATAFTAYGFFWLSLVIIWIFNKQGFEVDKVSMGFYLLLWALFTLVMFIGTLKHNRTSQIVFGSLMVLFLGLSLGDFTNVKVITIISGFIGIFCGLAAMYNAGAQIINQEFNKTVLPL